jgi:hypothetical protein
MYILMQLKIAYLQDTFIGKHPSLILVILQIISLLGLLTVLIFYGYPIPF